MIGQEGFSYRLSNDVNGPARLPGHADAAAIRSRVLFRETHGRISAKFRRTWVRAKPILLSESYGQRRGKLTENTEKPAIWFAPKTQRKRYKNQANGRFFRVYLVQSVHALHSERVNAEIGRAHV